MRMSYIFSQTTSLDTGRGLGDVFVWLDSRNNPQNIKPQEVWQPGRRPRFVTMVPMKNNILHVKFVWFQHTPASHTAFASARQQRDSGSKSSSAIPRFSSTIMLLVQDKQKLAFYTGFVPLLSSFVWPSNILWSWEFKGNPYLTSNVCCFCCGLSVDANQKSGQAPPRWNG